MIDLRTPSDPHPQILALIYHFAVRKSVSNCAANIGTLTVVVKRFLKVHPRSALFFKHFHPNLGEGNLLPRNAAAEGFLHRVSVASKIEKRCAFVKIPGRDFHRSVLGVTQHDESQ